MPKTTRSVERAVEILSCFSQEERALTLTQISERIRLNKSTVLRILGTLEKKGFVHRNGYGPYRLGVRLIELGSYVINGTDMQQLALPYLQQLANEFGETADLAVLDGCDVIYLQVVESPQRVKLIATPGRHLPAFCTASGKAFLAYLPDDQVKDILKQGLHKYTTHTKVTLSYLHEDLRITRERGFAISEEEYEESINAVSAPILNCDAHPLGAIALAGPSFRLPAKRMILLGPSVRAAADAIARDVALSSQFAPE